MGGINLIKMNGCYMVCIIIDQEHSVLCPLSKESDDEMGLSSTIMNDYLKIQKIQEPTPDIQIMLADVMSRWMLKA